VSLAELLVASGVLLAVTAVAGSAAVRAQLAFRAQPEVADMQQRTRVAASAIGHDLLMAGAGPLSTSLAGPLVRRFPPVAPYRRGQADDARVGVFYRPDALSLVYVPDTRAEADVLHAFDLGRELLVDLAPTCGVQVHERVCGFTVGMRVVLFDAHGAFDVATVTDVAGTRVRVQHGGLSSTYDGGAVMAEVAAPTYLVRTRCSRLVRCSSCGTTAFAPSGRWWTTWWTFTSSTSASRLRRAPWRPSRPRIRHGLPPPTVRCRCRLLPQLAPTPSPVPLDPAWFRDGPWCPNAAHAARFDADLLRIRRVRPPAARAGRRSRHARPRGTPVREGWHLGDGRVLRARSAGGARRDAAQPRGGAMIARDARSERGIALIAVMSATSLLLALGLSLALTTTIEVEIAANQRDAVQTLHAADAGLERAMADLALADWDAVPCREW
jgi:hypothetical protein